MNIAPTNEDKKSMVPVDAVLRLLLDKAYMSTDVDDGEQLVDGIWYVPVWGCDTLQYVVDQLLSMKSES